MSCVRPGAPFRTEAPSPAAGTGRPVTLRDSLSRPCPQLDHLLLHPCLWLAEGKEKKQSPHPPEGWAARCAPAPCPLSPAAPPPLSPAPPLSSLFLKPAGCSPAAGATGPLPALVSLPRRSFLRQLTGSLFTREKPLLKRHLLRALP